MFQIVPLNKEILYSVLKRPRLPKWQTSFVSEFDKNCKNQQIGQKTDGAKGNQEHDQHFFGIPRKKFKSFINILFIYKRGKPTTRMFHNHSRFPIPVFQSFHEISRWQVFVQMGKTLFLKNFSFVQFLLFLILFVSQILSKLKFSVIQILQLLA